jgi:hypothetical protein
VYAVALPVCKIHSFKLILTGNGPEGLIQKVEEKEEDSFSASFAAFEAIKQKWANATKVLRYARICYTSFISLDDVVIKYSDNKIIMPSL